MKTTNRKTFWFQRALLFSAFLMPSFAQAHPGHIGQAQSFGNGLAHPFSGLDHLCAMLAVGLWAAQLGGRMRWLLPMTFVTVMLAGGVLGLNGVNIPVAEQGIAASLLVLGIFIAAAVRLPTMAGMVVGGLFALFHGYAHGAEMPASAAGVSYAFGFVTASASLHLIGLGLGLAAQRLDASRWIRFAGAGIAACGIYFCGA